MFDLEKRLRDKSCCRRRNAAWLGAAAAAAAATTSNNKAAMNTTEEKEAESLEVKMPSDQAKGTQDGDPTPEDEAATGVLPDGRNPASDVVKGAPEDAPVEPPPPTPNTNDTTEATAVATAATTATVIVFQSDWSTALASPRDLPAFSPALDSKASLHGLGLRLAVERARSIGRFLREASRLLADVANVYDQFGVQMLMASQSIRPERLPFRSALDQDLQLLYETVKLYGDGFRSLAAYFRSDLLSGLQTKLADNAIEIDSTQGQYQTSRTQCVQSRQSALKAYAQLVKAVQCAEHAIGTWSLQMQVNMEDDDAVPGRDEGNPDLEILNEDQPWVKSLKRLGSSNSSSTQRVIDALNKVQSTKTLYEEAVSNENESVVGAQETESSSLQKIQALEQDRLNFYANSVVTKVFQGEAGMEGSVVSSTPTNVSASNLVDWEKSAVEGIEKKGKDLLANLFGAQSIPYEEGMGVMDAETLGLPEEIGSMRDQAKAKFSARESRIKTTELVLRYMNEISSLGNKSALSLKRAMQPPVSNSGGNIVSEWTKAASVFGAEAAYLWVSAINAFYDEARLISNLGSTISTTKLQNWLATAARALQNEIEMDDTAWKHVCDCARTEMKYQSRYLKTQQNINKARERVSSFSSIGKSSEGSFDSGDEPSQSPTRPLNSSNKSSESSSQSPNPSNRVGRALFKGGEAMKKLQEKARVQIAKTKLALDEVDQKEEKLQQLAEEAAEAKERAIATYKEYTEERIEKLVSSDRQGWSDLKAVIDELVSTTKSQRDDRCAALENTLAQELNSTIQALPKDVEEWLNVVKERIDQNAQSSVTAGETVEEYTLTVKAAKSSNVETLMRMAEDEKEIPKLDVPDIAETSIILEANRNDAEDGTPQDSSAMIPTTEEIPNVQRQPVRHAITAPAGERYSEENGLPQVSSSVAQPGQTGQGTKEESPAMKAFVKQFWSKKPANERPEILGVFQCAYKPKDKPSFLAQNLHGRLYTTNSTIYFLSWDNKNFILKWTQIVSVQKEKGFMGASNDNAIAITYMNGDSEDSFTLGRLELRDSTLSHLQSLHEESRGMSRSVNAASAASSGSANGASLPAVPPDNLIKSMDILVSNTIHNTDVKTVFEKVWSETSGSFYGDWLQDEECFEIDVPEWTYANDGQSIQNAWCKESYDQERLVSFKFKRTSHLYIGPPIALVKQKQYCRLEGDDRIVVAISAIVEGIPYADTFEVEVRWVARRHGANNVKVDVGSFVVFKKTTMLKSQIKAGTVSETKNVHLRFFEAVRQACSTPGDGSAAEDLADEVEEEPMMESKPKMQLLAMVQGQFESLCFDNTTLAIFGVAILSLFWAWHMLRSIFGPSSVGDVGRLESRIDELQNEVRALQQSLNTVIELLKESKP